MLQALSTTTAVSRWLESATLPHVLHVFDHVCNVVDGERRVISLVTPEIGNGPFSLVVDLAQSHFTDFVTSESQVSMNGLTLRIGSLVVDTSKVKFWNPQPLWEAVSASTMTTYLPLFEHKLATSSSDSLWHVNGHFETGRSDPTSLKAKTAVYSLQEGIKTDDLAIFRQGIRRLAGLGIGLTPAGDDFLMGVIYSLWLKKALSGKPVPGKTEVDERVEIFIKTIMEEAVAQTTTLSGAWLKAAAKGEAGQVWHQLVSALRDAGKTPPPTNSKQTISQAIDHILDTGHTSGADALAGFVMSITTKPPPSTSFA